MAQMKYHDNSTYATNPLHLTLSMSKLDDLLPELTRTRGLLPRLLRSLQGKPDLLAVLAEHIHYGDSQPALVLQIHPLLVAAYTVDIDCVAILKFPALFASKYKLRVKSKLVTINTYMSQEDYQPDLLPGPNRELNWTGVHPVVADFVSDDIGRIKDRKTGIDRSVWEYVYTLGNEYIRDYPGVHRDGRPFLSAKALFSISHQDTSRVDG